MRNKRDFALMAVCSGIFSVMVYFLALYYQYQINELDYIIWDLKTVTINDYTVEMKITDAIWNDF